MTESELYQHPGWQWCTAEGARKQVLALGLRSTLREKLEWLEEAETLALRFRTISGHARSEIDRGLAQVPDVPPLPGDDLPPGYLTLE